MATIDHNTQRSDKSDGTVIITGANGSLGFWFVQNLLLKYPSYSAILTVRDSSSKDQNTNRLRKLISTFPNAKVSVEQVDLASLSDTRSFADSIIERVSTGKLAKITAVACNAFNWSLVGQQNSIDGYDLTFQVTHLSHFVLVLKLLGSLNKENGRIVFLGSDAHDRIATNAFRPLGAIIPDNIEEIVKPLADTLGEEQGRGFQRYGTAKLATIMFMYLLNRKLLQDHSLKNITALAMDPGGIPNSRAFDNVPSLFKNVMYIAGYLAPVAKHFVPVLTTPQDAGRNLVAMCLGPEHKGARGYYLKQKQKSSSAESHDEAMQERVWAACEKWSNFQRKETILK